MFVKILQERNCVISIRFKNGKTTTGKIESYDNESICLRTRYGQIVNLEASLLKNVLDIRLIDEIDTQRNPFAHVGRAVSGELFVGRQVECQAIWDRAVNNHSFTQIVGLPRMGKSSIVKQCLITKKDDLLYNHKIILIHRQSVEHSALSFWKMRIAEICDQLMDLTIFDSKIIESIVEKYDIIDTINDLDTAHHNLCGLLQELRKSTGYTVLFVFDEFDKFQYKEEPSCFNKLHELASTFCTIVTVSRRPVEIIERKACGSAYLFNLHPQPFYIGSFSDEEIDQYWERCKPFLPFTQEQLSEYRKTVYSYVGGHPCLMDTLNNLAFYSLNNFQAEKHLIEKQLRLRMVKSIEEQKKYIEEQELGETAKNLLIGSEGINLDDDATLLKNYSFLKYIPSNQKEQLFGYQVGPRFEGAQMAYTCFSDFATILFYETYTKELPYAEKLKNTELALRAIVKYYLRHKYGNNCFDQDTSCPDKEIWEVQMRNDLQNRWNGSSLVTKFDNNIDLDKNGVKKAKVNQVNFELQDPSIVDNRCLVDFCTLGQLDWIFFRNCWGWFKHVFHVQNKMDWLEGQQNGDFYLVNKLRNSKDHLQMDYVSGARLDECIEACDRVCSCIDNFLKQHS